MSYLGLVVGLAVSCPSAHAAAAAGETLMGSWDLDGSGSLSNVYNSNVRGGLSKIRVEKGTSSYDYFVEFYGLAQSWKIMAVEDIDGQAGAEIILSVKYDSTHSRIQMITHRTHNSRDYYIGGAASTASWALMGVADVDGLAGKEILLNVSGSNYKEYKVLHNSAGYTTESSYSFNFGESVILLTGGIIDTDGKPGAEIVVNRGGTQVYIIHDANRTTYTYNISSSAWTILGFSEMDGLAGNEIAIKNGAYLTLIKDATRSSRDTYVSSSSWVFSKFQNYDGKAGNEIYLNVSGVEKIFGWSSGTALSSPTTAPVGYWDPNWQRTVF